MISAKITGLDKLQRQLEEAQRGLESLNGTITTLQFNPDDPASVRQAAPANGIRRRHQGLLLFRQSACGEGGRDDQTKLPPAHSGARQEASIRNGFMELYSLYGQPPRLIQPPVFQIPPSPPQCLSFGELLIGAGITGLAIWGAAELCGEGGSPQRTCGACRRKGHDRRICPYEGARAAFSRAIPKIRRCECCASSRYGTQRHHTRGRFNLSDFLDVCLDCHVDCCHDGHFQNLGKKPKMCCQTGNVSAWRRAARA
jgi:hypothetical protein